MPRNNMTKQKIAEKANAIAKSETKQGGRLLALTAKELNDMKIDAQPPIVESLLDRRDGLLITGSTGLGKTLVATQTGMAIASGRNLFGITRYSISQPYNVLIVQSEISIKNMKFRIGSQSQELKIKDEALNRLFFPWEKEDVRLSGDLLAGFDNILSKFIEKYEIEVVILDPLISFHSANENDNVQVRKALDVITNLSTKYDISTIICHHHGKLDLEGHYAARGASAIADWASTILTLKKQKGGEIVVNVSKVRNFERTPNFLLKREKGSLVFRPVESNGLVAKTDVADILAETGGSVESQNKLTELVQAKIGVSYKTALYAIKKAISDGIIMAEKVEGKKNQKRLRLVK